MVWGQDSLVSIPKPSKGRGMELPTLNVCRIKISRRKSRQNVWRQVRRDLREARKYAFGVGDSERGACLGIQNLPACFLLHTHGEPSWWSNHPCRILWGAWRCRAGLSSREEPFQSGVTATPMYTHTHTPLTDLSSSLLSRHGVAAHPFPAMSGPLLD